ncbi:MAG: SHOCT domain-containing protein [Desulfurivibrionaceae bacterium]|nr:SHOCT domain-containing protein [Desulfobulbales bacterium]MDT8335764.1 SHOCT domain-containing protein [Desulfurivibrionaceae bacterium]
MHMFSEYGMGGGGMMMMVLFWLVTIVAIFYILRALTEKSGGKATHPESAEEILKKRYAGGEITREEFEKIREDLK